MVYTDTSRQFEVTSSITARWLEEEERLSRRCIVQLFDMIGIRATCRVYKDVSARLGVWQHGFRLQMLTGRKLRSGTGQRSASLW